MGPKPLTRPWLVLNTFFLRGPTPPHDPYMFEMWCAASLRPDHTMCLGVAPPSQPQAAQLMTGLVRLTNPANKAELPPNDAHELGLCTEGDRGGGGGEVTRKYKQNLLDTCSLDKGWGSESPCCSASFI